MFLRGDFKVVVKAVLDGLWAHAASSESCQNLDLGRVALFGNSMGAYFALRGAASDERIKVRWELAHGILAFGVSSGSDVMDISQSFTLDRTDGTSLLADISCPTLVTDARDSVFRLDAQRIYDNLTQLKGGHTKIIWSPGCISDGSLQAKVAAFSHMHARFFGWLDGVFDINRPPPQTVV
ncbi:putative 2,6-dihydropseudooxynicotine hydrolase [Seiridium cardinale]